MTSNQIHSKSCSYKDDYIEAEYMYSTCIVEENKKEGKHNLLESKAHEPSHFNVENITRKLIFRTEHSKGRLGVMLVGLSGNNASTMIAGIYANKLKLSWETKTGIKQPNYFGSMMLASTTKIGLDQHTMKEVFAPISSLLPLCHPENWVFGGWDINNASVGDAMRRAQVLDIQLQDQLYPYLKTMNPLPGVYIKDFIADNQEERANNILSGKLCEQLSIIRSNIRDFKKINNVDRVIVLWTATTEKFCSLMPGVNMSAIDLLAAIEEGHKEISPSVLYATAAILENASFLNGSPQNTLVPGVCELAEEKNVFVGGDDFKSGQTKLKSVLVEFLVSAGIKPTSIVSYNHLGNNDGQNLSSFPQFRSKEISKSNVVDDMVESNKILYKNSKDYPDHCVVIKYVPNVGDSKRAMDEYVSEIFLNGLNTIVIHNTCEDSLLAAPIMIDLILLTELFERILVRNVTASESEDTQFVRFHHILSTLSYLLKAPLVPQGAPVINALMAQRSCIINILRACIGLPPENHMLLEHKIPFLMQK